MVGGNQCGRNSEWTSELPNRHFIHDKKVGFGEMSHRYMRPRITSEKLLL